MELKVEVDVPNLEVDVWAWAPDAASVRRALKRPPRWDFEARTVRLLVDVRPALPPIGQLLREVKHLRNLSGMADRAFVLVFCDQIAAETREMLEHEDCRVLTRAQLDSERAPTGG